MSLFKSSNRPPGRKKGFAPPESISAAMAGLPGVVESVGNSKTSLSAKITGVGAVSVAHGDLMNGLWKKNINEEDISEQSVRKEAMQVIASGLNGADTEAQGRRYAHLLTGESMQSFDDDGYLQQYNHARHSGPVRPPAITYQQNEPYGFVGGVHRGGESAMGSVHRGNEQVGTASVVPPDRFYRRDQLQRSQENDDVPAYVTMGKSSSQRAVPVGGYTRRPGIPPAEDK